MYSRYYCVLSKVKWQQRRVPEEKARETFSHMSENRTSVKLTRNKPQNIMSLLTFLFNYLRDRMGAVTEKYITCRPIVSIQLKRTKNLVQQPL
jgi:hypothetical protein